MAGIACAEVYVNTGKMEMADYGDRKENIDGGGCSQLTRLCPKIP
jgi:hypothetical protein